MRLGECHVENFGSYASLDFNYSNQKLCLIFGVTGSGKSTLPDIAAWLLYGQTSKGGTSTDICSWTFRGPTKGEINVTLSDGTEIRVYRERDGKRADLFWTEQSIGGHEMRGKDLKDTQRLLETRMGVSAGLFMLGGHLHEFSEVGTFFTAPAKDRRAVLERVADLRLASLVAERCVSGKRTLKSEHSNKNEESAKTAGRLEQASKGLSGAYKNSKAFDTARSARLAELLKKAENFEQVKKEKVERWEIQKEKEVRDLKREIALYTEKLFTDEYYDEKVAKLEATAKCGECGALDPKINHKILELLQQKTANEARRQTTERLQEQLKIKVKEVNPALTWECNYWEVIEDEKAKANPFLTQIERLEKDTAALEEEATAIQNKLNSLNAEIASLEQLQDLSLVLRGQLLTTAVNQLMAGTNQILDDYFDAELRVKFTLEDDEIAVSISKSGYEANFKQLSKGQRCLLRLAFSVTVMEAAANNAGVHLDALFFDEALDGLDSNLKVKAFRLFEHLATTHSTVLVIDHAPELQEKFTNKYLVTMEGDVSSVENVS